MANVSKKTQAQLSQDRDKTKGEVSCRRSATTCSSWSRLACCSSRHSRCRCGRCGCSRRSTPKGLGMEIHAEHGRGASEHDLQSINWLNHYIGMKTIEPDANPELRLMPWIIAGLAVAGVRRRARSAAAASSIAWLSCFAALGALGLVGFLSLGVRLRPRPRHRACNHQGARDDLSAAADRQQAVAQLHGELVAGDWQLT